MTVVPSQKPTHGSLLRAGKEAKDMPSVGFEKQRFLGWLADILNAAEDVTVDIVIIDEVEARSCVHVTVRDVPGRLAGFEVRRAVDVAQQPLDAGRA